MGDTAGALQTAQEIGGASDAIEAIRVVAVARASGGAAAARDAALLIQDASMQAQALTAIADAQVSAGQLDIAYETALAIDESRRAPALILVAGAYALAGDATTALRCYTEARRHAQATPDEEVRSEVLELIVAGEVRDGFAGEAIRLLDTSVPPSVLEALTTALAEAGETALLMRAVEACAEREELGPVVCESLVRAYPAQAAEIVERVLPMLTARA